MKEKPELFVLKDYLENCEYKYGKTMLLLPSWVEKTNKEVAEKVFLGIYKYGFEWVHLSEKPEWFGVRHIASVRSLCENMGIHPNGYWCICGRRIEDPVHFHTDEIENMSKEERIFL